MQLQSDAINDKQNMTMRNVFYNLTASHQISTAGINADRFLKSFAKYAQHEAQGTSEGIVKRE